LRISLLLQREPFGSILETTLSRFWSNRSGGECAVRWIPGSETGVQPGEQVWSCNPYLNAIFASGARAETFEPVSMEFARATRFWKRPLQWAYVRAATSSSLASRLAWKALAIAPALDRAPQLLLLGGNNRIRLLDREHGLSYVVLKDGFDSRYIERELRVRKDWADLPIPALVDVADDGSWFSERYILGRPVNRLGDRRLAGRSVGEAAAALQVVQAHTRQETDPTSYSAELATKADQLLSTVRWLEPELRQRIRQSSEDMVALVRVAARDGQMVTKAFSHGDFQPANILVTEDRTWLIDWESADVRQLAYDPLVYALGSRSTAGLACRVLIALAGRSSSNELLTEWPGLAWDRGPSRAIALILFLLEELVLHSEEASNQLFNGPGLELPGFVGELQLAANGLKSASSA
jgi:hypothetical protein